MLPSKIRGRNNHVSTALVAASSDAASTQISRSFFEDHPWISAIPVRLSCYPRADCHVWGLSWDKSTSARPTLPLPGTVASCAKLCYRVACKVVGNNADGKAEVCTAEGGVGGWELES